VYALVASSGQF